MTTVALSHGYPPLWNMGGEVALHRAMTAIKGDKFCLTNTDAPYTFEGVQVQQIDTPDVLNINADPRPIANQLTKINATVVIGQNELSLPAVLAAEKAGAVSIVNVHTPPKYGRNIANAVKLADYAVYNTQTSADEWGDAGAFVLHPPISPLPAKPLATKGDAYTLLSSLVNKGVQVMLDLAKIYPDQRFIIVRSPAEPTHGLANIEELVAALPNVELHPRVSPEDVHKYLKQTRILFVPSRYETYGMSAIEAAGYGIPSIHVDTPHVREGIGTASFLIKPLSLMGALEGIKAIEADYDTYSAKVRARAEWLDERQQREMEKFSEYIANIKKPIDNRRRQRAINRVTRNL